MLKIGLIRKIKLISKFVTSQPGQETIAMHNILRRKDNQAIKCGQLIEYQTQKTSTKCGGDTIPRPFPRKLKLSISLDQYSKVLYCLFLYYAKLRTIEIYGH